MKLQLIFFVLFAWFPQTQTETCKALKSGCEVKYFETNRGPWRLKVVPLEKHGIRLKRTNSPKFYAKSSEDYTVILGFRDQKTNLTSGLVLEKGHISSVIYDKTLLMLVEKWEPKTGWIYRLALEKAINNEFPQEHLYMEIWSVDVYVVSGDHLYLSPSE